MNSQRSEFEHKGPCLASESVTRLSAKDWESEDFDSGLGSVIFCGRLENLFIWASGTLHRSNNVYPQFTNPKNFENLTHLVAKSGLD